MIRSLFVLAFAAAGSVAAGPVPGWHLTGSNVGAYEIAVDREVFHGGAASASIHCLDPGSGGFGALMQTVRADDYLDRRVRLSAWVKAVKAGKPRLWLRVDGVGGETLAFDNMDERADSGTFKWRRLEIVLDVLPHAATLNFGIILEGHGQAWIDDVMIETVPPKVRATKPLRPPMMPQDGGAQRRGASRTVPLHVVNLDFEAPPAEPRP
jgi:AraC family transcriptional regulator